MTLAELPREQRLCRSCTVLDDVVYAVFDCERYQESGAKPKFAGALDGVGS